MEVNKCEFQRLKLFIPSLILSLILSFAFVSGQISRFLSRSFAFETPSISPRHLTMYENLTPSTIYQRSSIGNMTAVFQRLDTSTQVKFTEK